ncbi:rod shape-determining protein MreD [Rhodoferax sp.]|uniref:rod shape-determining protein MreD n=1 Tax=Rhodoferax sp. TaxID=50421 RepID=UPI001ECE9513|nr:rod shape-determining protein MreD [Rhodoferax sp.]MBT9507969.1 rod shape-determining protein MreD [Rhodoferax sp.]
MIMRPGQQLLLPANPLFIWGTLMVAMGFNMLQNMGLWGRAAWTPDILALALVFWSIHQPRRVGIGVAFLFGLLTDVHQGAMLGQHALAYTVLSFFAIAIHRRLLWFTVPSQALQVLPLFVAAHAIELTVRLMAGSTFPGLLMLLAPVLESLLWPVVSVILLLPQRRAPNPDAHRPL